MEDHRTGRRPYGDRVWPPPQASGPSVAAGPGAAPAERERLPPSARLYGVPEAPARMTVPFWVRRAAVVAVALAAGTALVAGLAAVITTAVRSPGRPAGIADATAGVVYPLPQGWRRGAVPPVTGFTSVAAVDDSALIMARPGGPADPGGPVAVSGPRAGALALAELYGRLLLHGDTVEVVDDRWMSVGGYTGHSRSLRATYSDVVNQPSFLRVALLTKGDKSVVVVGVAQPDRPERRAEIDSIINGLS